MHLAAISADQRIKLFVNGQLFSEIDEVIFTPATQFAACSFVLLSRSQTNFGFVGVLEELRVWLGERTPSQLAANKNKPQTGGEPGLMYYSRFDGEGQVVTDEGPSALVGTMGMSPAEGEDDPTRIASTAPIRIPTSADLSLTVRASNTSVAAGDNFTYTLVVANEGTEDATNVEVSSRLSGLQVNAVAMDQACTQSGPNIVCDFGDVAPGTMQTAELTFSAAASPGELRIKAQVLGEQAENNTTNNADQAQTEITPPVATNQ